MDVRRRLDGSIGRRTFDPEEVQGNPEKLHELNGYQEPDDRLLRESRLMISAVAAWLMANNWRPFQVEFTGQSLAARGVLARRVDSGAYEPHNHIRSNPAARRASAN